jgi:outer membrane receptor protein involved in Fe transport
MNHKRDSLSEAIKRALGLTVSLTTLTGGAFAVAQEDEEVLTTEEVLVTGSRIKRADLDNANPVTVVTRDEMMLTGITDVGDLIQRLPSMSGSPIGTTTNNGGNGSVTIDLRGLGAGRTLNLINGRRSVDGGDYQTIPAAMVERIEILKDGGAAAYGADAVAGVVNIVTRDDFEGVEVELLTADWMDTDSGSQTGISAVFGKSFDKGHFVAGVEYVDQEEAYQSDAPWDFFQDSYYIYPTGCEAQVAAGFDGTSSGGCYPIGSSRIPEGRLATISQGTFMNPDGSGLVPFDGRTYNYAPVNYIQTPYKKTNIFLDGRMEITDNIEFSAMLRSNNRKSAQELAPQPYNSPTDPAYNGVWVDGGGNEVAYSGISPDNYYLVQAFNAAGLSPEPIRDARRRMVETTRRFEQQIEQTQINLQLDGSELFGTDISWTAYYNYGRRTREDVDYGQFFGPNLSNAMGPSADLNGDGQPECYQDINDPNSVISGCVPFNFFGGPGSVTQEMIDYVAVNLVDTIRQELDSYGVDFTGSMFNLPGGEIGWAAGYQKREEIYRYSPDSGKQKDEVTGNTGTGTSGDYEVDSFYAELLLPVLDNVEFSVGWRYEDFSTYGSEDVWKVGGRWDITDNLAVRGTWGEVFRSPTISDLFGGLVDSFPTFSDPCSTDYSADGSIAPGCAQEAVQLDSQVLAREGGNPGLKAETGETMTLGVVWTPTIGPVGIEATLDYWEVELEDGITSLGVNYILDDCYNGGNQSACDLVTRRADYTIAQILDAPINASELYSEGIDLGLDATWDLGNSQLSASVLWSHFLENYRKSFPDDTEFDLVGRYAGQAFAEDKANFQLSWEWNSLRVSWLGEYIGELDSPAYFFQDYDQKIDSQFYHDIIVDYNFDRTGTTISAGITNVSDEAPPYLDEGFNAKTDPSTYRMFGQGYYIRIKQSF